MRKIFWIPLLLLVFLSLILLSSCGCKHPTVVVDPAVEPTCTETGLTEGSHCDVCQEILRAQSVVPAKGHVEEVIPAVPPTETETGLSEGLKCAVCGTILQQPEVIPALSEKTVPTEEEQAAFLAKAPEIAAILGQTFSDPSELPSERILYYYFYTVAEEIQFFQDKNWEKHPDEWVKQTVLYQGNIEKEAYVYTASAEELRVFSLRKFGTEFDFSSMNGTLVKDHLAFQYVPEDGSVEIQFFPDIYQSVLGYEVWVDHYLSNIVLTFHDPSEMDFMVIYETLKQPDNMDRVSVRIIYLGEDAFMSQEAYHEAGGDAVLGEEFTRTEVYCIPYLFHTEHINGSFRILSFGRMLGSSVS
ncbi:MAG: hypothetical protein II797_01975 [Clostridia bacterium]|nr:hypothetical protein [Clostridia bacterium]